MNTVDPLARFNRQTVIPVIGREGQVRLAQKTAVVIGIGGLGSNIANMLARAGVGHLRLVDPDTVDMSNLHRQYLYTEDDVTRGRKKAEIAAERLHRANSAGGYEPVVERLDGASAERLIAGADVVMDALDNMESRGPLNQACVKRGIPLIHGAFLGTHGQSVTVLPGETGCLQCLMPELVGDAAPPQPNTEVGVIGPGPALVAAWQSLEAIKILVEDRAAVSRALTIFDLWSAEIASLPFSRSPQCGACADRRFDLLAAQTAG